MINCNNLNDFLAGKGEVFADITESVKLFKKMKDQKEPCTAASRPMTKVPLSRS